MNRNILIVEDDETLLEILHEYLEAKGYTVSEARLGTEALDRFSETSIDAIVSDIKMPEMDGFEFCRRLRDRREGRFVPFIFLSTRSQVEDRIKGYKFGADDYLVKPFELEELGAKLEMLLERSYRLQRDILQMLQVNNSPPSPPPETSPAPLPDLPLTPAEQQVFAQVAQGLTNKEVGERLFISPRTVQAHLRNILRKLDLKSRSQLILLAAERGNRRSD